jgi:hypothetical protein
VSGLENHGKTEFLVAQFEALREEMDHKDQMRLGAIKFAVVASGLLWSVFIADTKGTMPSWFPFLVFFGVWASVTWIVYSMAKIRQRLGSHIAKIERAMLGENDASTLGWENVLQSTSRSRWHYVLAGWLAAANMGAAGLFAHKRELFPYFPIKSTQSVLNGQVDTDSAKRNAQRPLSPQLPKQ